MDKILNNEQLKLILDYTHVIRNQADPKTISQYLHIALPAFGTVQGLEGMFLYFIDLENINVKTPYIPCPIMNQLQW
jgi:hypothetical protein